MSDDISATFESYIYQEKSLLNQLSQIRGQRRDFQTELEKDAVGELVNCSGEQVENMLEK